MGLRSFEHAHVETDADQVEANEACTKVKMISSKWAYDHMSMLMLKLMLIRLRPKKFVLRAPIKWDYDHLSMLMLKLMLKLV